MPSGDYYRGRHRECRQVASSGFLRSEKEYIRVRLFSQKCRPVCSRKNAGPETREKKTLTSIPGGEPASRDLSQVWTTACEEFDNRAKLRIRIACVKIGIEQNSEFASPAQKSEFGPSPAQKSEWPSPEQKLTLIFVLLDGIFRFRRLGKNRRVRFAALL